MVQERAVRTREALVRAAGEVLAVEGFAGTSLGVIARRAGVSVGALHFHFPSKEALVRAVEAEAGVRVRRVAAACAGGDSALVEVVGAAFGVLRVVVDDPVVRAGFRLGADPSRKGDGGLLVWWRGFVRERVVRAGEAGELVAHVSVEDAARVIVVATVGFEAVALAEAQWPSVERVAAFWSLVLPWLAVAPEGVMARVLQAQAEAEGGPLAAAS